MPNYDGGVPVKEFEENRKEGISRFSATCVPLEEFRRLISEAARRALGKVDSIQPFVVQVPFEFRVECSTSDFCDTRERLSGLPGIRRPNARTMLCEVDDLRTFKALL